MDCAYAGIAYPYKFSGLEGLLRALGDMFSADMYVRNSFKLVAEDDQAGAQSRKMHFDYPDPTVSAASLPSDVYPAKSGSTVPDNGSQSISNVNEKELMKVDTACEISNLDDV